MMLYEKLRPVRAVTLMVNGRSKDLVYPANAVDAAISELVEKKGIGVVDSDLRKKVRKLEEKNRQLEASMRDFPMMAGWQCMFDVEPGDGRYIACDDEGRVSLCNMVNGSWQNEDGSANNSIVFWMDCPRSPEEADG